jgi:hypothetical protein
MRAQARAAASGASEGTWFGDPSLELITEKLFVKRYETPHPIELLAFGDDTLFPYEIWLPSFADRIRALLTAALTVERRSGKAFGRVWVANLGRLSRERPIWLVHPGVDGLVTAPSA